MFDRKAAISLRYYLLLFISLVLWSGHKTNTRVINCVMSHLCNKLENGKVRLAQFARNKNTYKC